MSIAETFASSRVRITSFAILGCLGGLASRYAVPFAFRYSMSFLPLVVAVLLFALYHTQLANVLTASRKSLRLTITCAITALLCSAFLVFGSWAICDDPGSLSGFHILAILLNAFPLYTLLVVLMGWLDQRAAHIRRRTQQPNAFRLSRKGCLIIFAVLLLCWLPIFLAAFPGFFCYDMTGDSGEYTQFTTGTYSADLPTFHVLLLGALMAAGQALTGTVNGGVAFYVCLQALIMSALFTFVISTIAKASASKLLTVATVAYLGLDPLVSLFVMCTTRDTLFGAFAVLFAVLLFDFFHSTGEQPGGSVGARTSLRTSSHIRSLVALGLTALLVCFLRPNGIIAIIVLTPFLIAFAHSARARLQMGALCAAVLLVCGAWFGPIAGALGVQPSPTARFLVFSLPAQQITNVVKSGTASEEELQALIASGFGIPMQDGTIGVNERIPQRADIARWNLTNMADTDVLAQYIALGFAHPAEYFEAFVDLTQAAWNPYSYASVYPTEGNIGPYEGRATSLFECTWEEPVSSQSLAPGVLSVLENISGELTLQNVPLVALLVSVPFYLWMLILLLARTIITLDRSIAAPCILLVALTATAFFGPAVLVRYYLPIIFGLPLMVTLLSTAHEPQPIAAQAKGTGSSSMAQAKGPAPSVAQAKGPGSSSVAQAKAC